MQVVVDNLLISYERKGTGKLLLLLHGWGDNYHTFRNIAPDLSDKFEVLAPDLPGFGDSQPPPEPWNLDDYAKLLNHFLKKLDLGDPYALIGHSNGGALAIRALATGELKADNLVLIASAGVRNSQKGKRAATKVLAKAGKATTFWLNDSTKQKLRRKLYGTVGSDMLSVPSLEETFKLTVRQDVQADAASLNLPTLIINADKDPAIPLEDGKKFNSQIKDSKLIVLNSSSHFIHQQQPQKVAKLIKEFL